MNQWFRDLYERPAYLRLYEQLDREQAPREAAAAASLLRLRQGQRVLDLACGFGRHVAEFERLGFRAYGVDLSAMMLARATTYAAEHRLRRRYVRADLRALPFPPVLDAATSFFVSFGFLSDRQNALVIKQFASVLRRGGRLLIDTWNARQVAASRTRKFIEKREDGTIIERSRYRRKAHRLEWSNVVRFRDGTRERWSHSVRVYNATELRRLLRAAGFRKVVSFGDWDGRPFANASPRLIIVATR